MAIRRMTHIPQHILRPTHVMPSPHKIAKPHGTVGEYSGKSLLLYHRTTRERARQIVKTQTFDPTIVRKEAVSENWPVFFSNRRYGSAKGHGRAVVSVVVPRKVVKPDPALKPFWDRTHGERHYEVTPQNLKGRKLMRGSRKFGR